MLKNTYKIEHNGEFINSSTEVSGHGSIDTSKIKPTHVVIFLVIVVALLLFHFRNRIGEFHDRLRTRRRMRYVNLSNGFNEDLENGFTSDTFDITNNNNNDSREGLLEEAKGEIKDLMERENLSFDQARLKYTRQQFKENNIDSNGMPLDPKTVTFN